MRDVRLALEDLVVNPWTARGGGRLDLLGARRVALEQATIGSGDLRAFLHGLKGFRRAAVTLEPGGVAFTFAQPGPDVAVRIRVTRGDGSRPQLVAERVRLGGVPVPGLLVDWVVRSYDPSPRWARLPIPIAVGRVEIAPDAVRIRPAP